MFCHSKKVATKHPVSEAKSEDGQSAMRPSNFSFHSVFVICFKKKKKKLLSITILPSLLISLCLFH